MIWVKDIKNYKVDILSNKIETMKTNRLENKILLNDYAIPGRKWSEKQH